MLTAMDASVRYARSGDVSVAYQVTGGGPFDLVLLPGFFSHLELAWEHADHRRFLERLGAFARLIRLEKRGTACPTSSLAGAGQVFVSATTRDLVAGSGLAFEDRGEHELEGLGERRRLFRSVE
jgi:hypothetical protein